jgi:bifunctional non-homologous end joining protein LigD
VARLNYREKRDFARTPEPEPDGSRPASSAGGEPIFVIHEHAARRLHYDLRLEVDGVLKSWAIPKEPSPDPEVKRLAVMVEDHPLDYASFEGTIPEGEYGAGEVRVWDRGTYVAEEHGKAFDDRKRSERGIREGIAAGKISFVLRGERLKGSWTLVKTRRIKDKENWLLIKHKDEWVSPVAGDEAKAGLADLAGKRRAPLPSSYSPMLATPASSPPSNKNARWFWEPKLDGYRIVALIRNGKAVLLSRNALDMTDSYPDVARQLGAQNVSALALDGEIVAMDEKGRPCFQCLQHLSDRSASRNGAATAVVYYVFDVLHVDGYEVLQVPLQRRKELLAATLKTSDAVQFVEYFTGDGQAIYRSAVDTGFEGIVGKMRDSTYEPGVRSRSWVKIKAVLSDDFVVGGFSPGTGSRSSTFGALLLGQYDQEGKLQYVGHVGSGFDGDALTDLRRRLGALETDRSPFASVPRLKTASAWVRPEMVVEVKFDQRTRDGYLRIPVFLRVRDDKPAGEARPAPQDPKPTAGETRSKKAAVPNKVIEGVLEQLQNPRDSFPLDVDGHRIELTNLSKSLWPSGARPITKRDLLVYLAKVSPYLLRHTLDRPLSLTRYPDGVDGLHFYQKHWPDKLPEFVKTARIYSRHEGWQQYLMCQNLATLLWMGQMANLEFHVWFSRVAPKPDGDDIPKFTGPPEESADFYTGYPDFIVFDLDPYIFSGHEAKGAEPELNRQAYARTCRVALWLKELLDGLSLSSFVKTSGRTGLHVYVPILRHFGFDAVRQGAATIASRLLQEHPGDITIEWPVERRTGKVFIDYNQNVRGKTLACAYSPRPAPGGTVSLPLLWEEIEKVYPTDFTILTASSRLAETGDLWQDLMQSKSDLKGILQRPDELRPPTPIPRASP